MRILHVITSLLIGGAEKLVVDLVPKLWENGYEVDIAVFNATDMPLLPILRRRCPNCKVYEMGHSFYNLSLIFKLRQIMKEYDIIHTHNSSPQLFSLIANIGMHKRLVTTEHSTNNRKREHRKYFWVDRWMYREYDKVIAISDVARDKLLEHLGWETNNDKVITVNNGVNVSFFHQAEPADNQQLGFASSHRFVAVMVAGFREAKDQDTLVRAMVHLPKDSFEVWLVGIGDRESEVKSLVQRLKLSGNVRFLGLRHDVANVLSASDVVVMSSHWEGLSLSNIEGMSVGNPFVASDVDGLREVTEGYGILFPHEDDKALADIIMHLSTDSNYYHEVAEKCYQRAKEFDLEKMVKKYESVYDSLMK